MNLHIYTSNMKVCLIFSIFVVYFCSCYGALNVTEELMFLKETVLLQKERIDGLQQTVGNILQRNEQTVPSETPRLADITDRKNDVLVEKSSKTHWSSSLHCDEYGHLRTWWNICNAGNLKRLLQHTQSSMSQSTVAFFAYMSNTEPNISTHHLLIFDHAVLNTGNGYHPNSGIFIAPKTGVYVFVWTVRIYKQSIVLVVNGSIYVSIYNRSYEYSTSGGVGADESVTGYAVVNVNQGDDVYLRSHSTYAGRGSVQSSEMGRSTFGGWILN